MDADYAGVHAPSRSADPLSPADAAAAAVKVARQSNDFGAGIRFKTMASREPEDDSPDNRQVFVPIYDNNTDGLLGSAVR
jgi:hypothetical protein